MDERRTRFRVWHLIAMLLLVDRHHTD